MDVMAATEFLARSTPLSTALHRSARSGDPALDRDLGRTLDDRNVVAGELVRGQKLAHFHLDQVEQFASSTMSTLFMYTTSAGTPT